MEPKQKSKRIFTWNERLVDNIMGNKFQLPENNILVPVVHQKLHPWPKLADKVDQWLDSLGFYRKHIARDSSSLFRCIAEHVYLTQVYHLTVRKQCIEFAENNQGMFQKISASNCLNEYVDRLRNQREPGNLLDIQIMSLLYNDNVSNKFVHTRMALQQNSRNDTPYISAVAPFEYDFTLYTDIDQPPKQITSNNFNRKIVLSLTNENHFDTVYTKDRINNMALCQSIVYEVLYKEVFELEEVDYAIKKMLHDKPTRYQKELNAAFFSAGFEMRLEMRDSCKNVKDLLDIGITPFPYKVAKALDPTIYRNVEFDTWNEQKKGARHGPIVWNSRELQIGSKCYILFKDGDNVVKHHAYIQEMSADKGPVLAFDEELGEKIVVAYDTLELIQTPIPHVTSALQILLETKLKQLQKNRQNNEQTVDNEGYKPSLDVSINENRYNKSPTGASGSYKEQVCQSPTVLSSTCEIREKKITSGDRECNQHYQMQASGTSAGQFNCNLRCENVTSAKSHYISQCPISVPSAVPISAYNAVIVSSSVSQNMSAVPHNAPLMNSVSKCGLTDATDTMTFRYFYNYGADPYYKQPTAGVPYYVITSNYMPAVDSFAQSSDCRVSNNYEGQCPFPLAQVYSPGGLQTIARSPQIEKDCSAIPIVPQQIPLPLVTSAPPNNTVPIIPQANNPALIPLCSGMYSLPSNSSILSVSPHSAFPSSSPPIYYQTPECDGSCMQPSYIELPYSDQPVHIYQPPAFIPTYIDDMYPTTTSIVYQSAPQQAHIT